MIDRIEAIRLRDEGKTYREIGKIFNVSRQRVWEVVLQVREKRKRIVLTHYGNGKCACVNCGFDDLRALSIDHIDGHGAEHRRRNNIKGVEFYKWLIKNNYPEGYQTLCMNCQWIKMSVNVEYTFDGKYQRVNPA